MFLDSMSPQEVVDAINEAYNNREFSRGNIYEGIAKNGIKMEIILNKDGKIITAYPVLK